MEAFFSIPRAWPRVKFMIFLEESVLAPVRNALWHRDEQENLGADTFSIDDLTKPKALPCAGVNACINAEIALHGEAFFTVSFDISNFAVQERLRDLDRKHFGFLDNDPMASPEAIEANFSAAAYAKLAPAELATRLRHKDRKLRTMGFNNKFLPHVLEIGQGVPNFFISQCDFRRPKRQGIHLLSSRAIWLDLDLHRPGCVLQAFADNEPYIVGRIIKKCAELGAPLPSLIYRSGRGYYVKFLTDRLPAAAFPRVRAVMDHLAKGFEDFGADAVSDSSRILRIGGSINPKAGAGAVRLIHNRIDLQYRFEELAKVLPVERTPQQAAKWALQRTIRQKEQKRAKESQRVREEWIKKNPSGQRKPLPGIRIPASLDESIWAARDTDFQKLIELRGAVAGHRELLVFYRLNAGLWTKAVTAENFWEKAREYSAGIPLQDGISAIESSFQDLYKRAIELAQGKTRKWTDAKGLEHDVPPIFRYSNETLIAKLAITDDEARHMDSLVPPGEQARRKREKEQERRRAAGAVPRATYVAECAERRATALHLRAKRLSFAAIGKTLGISMDAARKLCARALQATKEIITKKVVVSPPGQVRAPVWCCLFLLMDYSRKVRRKATFDLAPTPRKPAFQAKWSQAPIFYKLARKGFMAVKELCPDSCIQGRTSLLKFI